MHVHYGRWQHSVCGPGDAGGIIAEMDRCGIERAVLTSIDACYGVVSAGNAAVAEACRRYPKAQFLAAHAGGINLRDGIGLQLAAACREHPNLFLDLGSSRMVPGVLEWLVETAGVDRVLYGSDYPIFDFGYEYGRVDCSSLGADEQQRVLYGNATGLLRLM